MCRQIVDSSIKVVFFSVAIRGQASNGPDFNGDTLVHVLADRSTTAVSCSSRGAASAASRWADEHLS
jgi:hypothetical protein